MDRTLRTATQLMADAIHFVSNGVNHEYDDRHDYDDQPAPPLKVTPVPGVYGIGENFEIAGEVVPGILLSAANGDDTRPWVEAYFVAGLYHGAEEEEQGIDFGFPGDLEAAYVLADLIGAEVWTAKPFGSNERCPYLKFKD